MPKTKKTEDDLLAELARSYCNFCQNSRIKITRTIKIECPKCGKIRLIQTRL